jgi:hypothetical protein
MCDKEVLDFRHLVRGERRHERRDRFQIKSLNDRDGDRFDSLPARTVSALPVH